MAGAAAVGMTALRTKEHNDSDLGWDGPVVTALSELPMLLRAESAWATQRKAETQGTTAR